MHVRNMTQGSPTRLIFSVALPLMVGNVFQQLYTVVDAQVVGMVNGVAALAALGASDWFNWLYLSIVQGFAQGFAIPMAQAFGAQDYPGLRKYVGNAVFLSLIIGLSITFISLLSIHPVLHLLGTPQAIRPMSVTYLSILFSAYPLTISYNLMASILRALGDGRSPLYAMAVASLTNIALDVLFVAGFGWGIPGAAAATDIAQIVACLFCLYRLKAISFVHPSRKDLRPHGPTCLHLMRLGIPVAAQNGIIGVGGLFIQRVVNQMGVVFIAGYTATSKLYGVLEIAAVSYGYAISTYAGQNLGAKLPRRIKKGVNAALVTGVITALVICLIMFVFGKSIVSSFISGTPQEIEQAVGIACEFLYIMSAGLPILYILHIYRSTLQGLGNTLCPMLSGLGELIMRIGCALLLPRVMGYQGLFWAEIMAWIGADLFLIPGYYLTCRRIKKRLAIEGCLNNPADC